MRHRPQVRFYDDTLREMARWAVKYYGLGRLGVAFCARIEGGGSRLHNSGVTSLYSDHSALIQLNTRRTYHELIHVLAHELTHVLTWKRARKADHGPEFWTNFRKLVHAWNRHLESGEL